MTLREGLRVKLAADLRLAGSLTLAERSSDEEGPGDPVDVGSLSLGEGAEGTVERVYEDPLPQTEGVREYERLKSLLDDFGHQMPPGSRKQLEDRVGSLEPEWIAYRERGPRATVRVRLDNGFVLDDVPEDVFVPA
ncbi:hypothetical protein [Streptomyces sp. RerS4]|uniref:hypothetical protein n=1 Tax=Streptomyces sp. RerS4 TaxID=2942449 RepID=UPI00201BB32F|nr:hypothetical protein [Streptomyces sp. RerS4]UQX00015.1 hypothetical protein M4D82_05270 [Streptomyces sp. RerS4]